MTLGFVSLLLGAGLAPTAMAESPPPSARAQPVSAPAASGSDASSGPWHSGVRTFNGRAFDVCRTPSLDTMRRWRESKYQAIGVYFAGRARACPNQEHLDRDWTRAATGMGWRILPIYVGSQSPCVYAHHKKDTLIGRDPWAQGVREARDAVDRAERLAIGPSSPLYLDMEAYAHRKKPCARTTLSFVRAWDREVTRQGYVPGFYSSAGSGVRHMEEARRAGVADLPAVMWFARWQARPGLYEEPTLKGRASWHPQRRIHQYAGNVKERHGGRTLWIDRNMVDAPVARIG
ncbi:glycoside hydrolase domain-containing protein [Streptomyces sp. WG-D5]